MFINSLLLFFVLQFDFHGKICFFTDFKNNKFKRKQMSVSVDVSFEQFHNCPNTEKEKLIVHFTT